MQHNLHEGKSKWSAMHRDQEIESWLRNLRHAQGPDPEPVVQDV